MRTRPCLIALLGLGVVPGPALADAPGLNRLEVEALAIRQTRNTVQSPNDAQGDRFDLKGLLDAGPEAGLRVTYTRAIAPRQDVVLLYAPLRLDGRGPLPRETRFQGGMFAAGQDTAASYQFDSYRATWRYQLTARDDLVVKVGVTGKVRDARIALSQDAVRAERSNTGFVPLLHLYGAYRLGQGLHLVGDVDGLAGGPGRAIDLGVKLRYALTGPWSAQLGWRLLDGGVDTEQQYNFARFQSLTLGVAATF